MVSESLYGPRCSEGPEELVFTQLVSACASCPVRSQRISTVFHSSLENEISIPFKTAVHIPGNIALPEKNHCLKFARMASLTFWQSSDVWPGGRRLDSCVCFCF